MSEPDLILEWESTPREAAAEFRRLARRSRWWRATQAFALLIVFSAVFEFAHHEWSSGLQSAVMALLLLSHPEFFALPILVQSLVGVPQNPRRAVRNRLTVDSVGFRFAVLGVPFSPWRLHWSRLRGYESDEPGYVLKFDRNEWCAIIPRRAFVTGDVEESFRALLDAHIGERHEVAAAG